MAASSSGLKTSGLPELKVAETWDLCIENTARKLGYGILGGVFLGFALFRAPTARSAVSGIGAGLGVGMGWSDCTHKFNDLEKTAK